MRKEQQKISGATRPKCGVCSKWGHSGTHCPQRPCTNCGAWSHIASQCRSEPGAYRPLKRNDREVYSLDYEQPKVDSLVSVSEPFHMVDSGQGDVASGSGVNMAGLNGDVKKLIYVRVLLGKEKKKIEALVDTRSSYNVLSKSLCKRMGLTLSPCQHQLVGFNGLKSPVIGTMTLSCCVGNWNHELSFMVVDHNAKTILGYTGLKKLKLTVNSENDSLQDERGLQLLCHAMQEIVPI